MRLNLSVMILTALVAMFVEQRIAIAQSDALKNAIETGTGEQVTPANGDGTTAPGFSIVNPAGLDTFLVQVSGDLFEEGVPHGERKDVAFVLAGVTIKVTVISQDPENTAQGAEIDITGDPREIFICKGGDGNPTGANTDGSRGGSLLVHASHGISLILFGGDGGDGGEVTKADQSGSKGGAGGNVTVNWKDTQLLAPLTVKSSRIFLRGGKGGSGSNGMAVGGVGGAGMDGGSVTLQSSVGSGKVGFTPLLISGTAQAGMGGDGGTGARNAPTGAKGGTAGNGGKVDVEDDFRVTSGTTTNKTLELKSGNGGKGGDGGKGPNGGDALVGGNGGDIEVRDSGKRSIAFLQGGVDSTRENISVLGSKGANGTPGETLDTTNGKPGKVDGKATDGGLKPKK